MNPFERGARIALSEAKEVPGLKSKAGRTDSQRVSLAKAAAMKLCRGCWDAGVEQVAHEVDGRVLIYPWPGRGPFSKQDYEIIKKVWSSLGASKYIELVHVDHLGGSEAKEVGA